MTTVSVTPSIWISALLYGSIGTFLLCTAVQYYREIKHLRFLMRRARRIRAWRERMTTMADEQFRVQLLTDGERLWLVNRAGLSSEEWLRSASVEFFAGRRAAMPTCRDYLREFGKHPKVRTAPAVGVRNEAPV